MAYCDQLDMLCIGLSSGEIICYTLEIESFVYYPDTGQETNQSPNGDYPQSRRK